jgi:DNA-binding transcriptional MerR regulator
MNPAVESQRQVQLTFHDKSTDANLSAEVTREAWLSEVESQLQAQVPAAALIEPGQRTEPQPTPTVEEASAERHEAKRADDAGLVPNEIHGVDVEEIDFMNEPLPEPLTEASEIVVSTLGSLTLPAALCDEELLQELAGIPEKMGFKIGEVAEMLGIKQYVLRYWETEFDVLKPKKAANNQRYYTKKDVENVYLIRKLLHRDRFSIEGARAALKDLKNVVKKEKDWSQVNHKVEAMHERVDHLVMDLRKLRQLFAD